MAAEVSRQIKTESSKSCLTTRDFFGNGGLEIESKELDLDLHVPSGWEKRLDLKSGKVYIQRCNSTNSQSSEQRNNQTPNKSPKFQDLFHPPSSNINPTTLCLLEDTNLDLKLVSNCSPSSYSSVCTLDKVKSALDRAERTSASSSSSSRKRWMIRTVRSPSSTSVSNASVSMKDGTDVEDEESRVSGNGGLVAAACPCCLLYVLISRSDPKCPKCNSFVQMPLSKKPKIDLNISI